MSTKHIPPPAKKLDEKDYVWTPCANPKFEQNQLGHLRTKAHVAGPVKKQLRRKFVGSTIAYDVPIIWFVRMFL